MGNRPLQNVRICGPIKNRASVNYVTSALDVILIIFLQILVTFSLFVFFIKSFWLFYIFQFIVNCFSLLLKASNCLHCILC